MNATEHPGKMAGVVEADSGGNIADAKTGFVEQLGGEFHAHTGEEGHGRVAIVLSEEFVEVLARISGPPCKAGDAPRLFGFRLDQIFCQFCAIGGIRLAPGSQCPVDAAQSGFKKPLQDCRIGG